MPTLFGRIKVNLDISEDYDYDGNESMINILQTNFNVCQSKEGPITGKATLYGILQGNVVGVLLYKLASIWEEINHTYPLSELTIRSSQSRRYRTLKTFCKPR